MFDDILLADDDLANLFTKTIGGFFERDDEFAYLVRLEYLFRFLVRHTVISVLMCC